MSSGFTLANLDPTSGTFGNRSFAVVKYLSLLFFPEISRYLSLTSILGVVSKIESAERNSGAS